MKHSLWWFIVFALPVMGQPSSTIARHVVTTTGSLPATCSPNPDDIYTVYTAGTATPYYCSAPNTWTVYGTGAGGPPTGAAGGVLSGTYPNPGLTSSATAIPNGWTATTQATGDASTNLANDAFVAGVVASINPAVSVQAATVGVLSNTPTYSNGTAGVGATLTAGSNGALTIDGYAVLLNDRVLVKNQASALQNGAYTLTTLGNGGVPYVLTRATD